MALPDNMNKFTATLTASQGVRIIAVLRPEQTVMLVNGETMVDAFARSLTLEQVRQILLVLSDEQRIEMFLLVFESFLSGDLSVN